MELAANKIFRTIAANPDNYPLGNYEVYGELRVEKTPDSGLFEKTLSARLTPDVADNAVFELQDGAADFYPLPDFNPALVTGISLCTDNQVRAQFYHTESYGDPPVLQELILSSTFRILNGGLPKKYNGDFFGVDIQTLKTFLTWHPGSKRVTMDQPELLHFYAYAGIETITQRVKVYFNDNTDTIVIKQANVPVLQDRIYRIPAGYLQLELQNINPSKRIVKYDVWLTDQSNIIVADPFTYRVEEVPSSNSRFWMFTNSLGMWEIIRTEGRSTESIQVDRQVSAAYLPQGYSRFDGEFKSEVIGSQNDIDVSTGYFDSKEESLWATELMLSQKVVLLEPSARVPYIITSNSREKFTDKEYNWSLTFNARLAFNDTKYSRI